MRNKLYKVVDIFCSKTLWLIICSIILILCPNISWNYFGDKRYILGLICLFFVILAIIVTQLINNNSEKIIKEKERNIREINEKNKKLEQNVEIYSERYCSLLRLMDTLFDTQMMSLHNEIDHLVAKDIRTSIYIYDNSCNEFHCLARYSTHPIYCKKNKQEKYPNKGWLQSTWNNKKYEFTSNYRDVNDWVKDCQNECKKNCINDVCKKACISGKKEKLLQENCVMLSKNELIRKNMKAKSVFGVTLQQGTNSMGIILIESMEVWNPEIRREIEKIVFQHSSSPLEILSLHGKQLLELLCQTEQQKDVAEGFVKGGQNAK